MINKDTNKKYDLEIRPKEVTEIRKPSFFDESSSSDDESNKIPTLSFSSNFKKQDTSKFEKALLDDPTIYDYDSVYDQISTASSKISKSESKFKPTLAKVFIESAEKKNIRYQVVLSKKAKRENEIDKKEVFVTSAYKKEHAKLLAMDREDRQQAQIEDQHDLSKQSGTSAIYRYMLDEKMNSSSVATAEKIRVAKEAKEEKLKQSMGEGVPPNSELTEQPPKDNSDKEEEEDDIVKEAVKAKLVRDKASIYLQKPDTKYMLARFAKKNDATSIENAKERFLQRKMATKRAIVEDDSD